MNNYSKLLSAVAVVLVAAFVVPTAAAQSTLGFGTQVKLGDVDFVPTSATVGAALSVIELEFGLASQVSDNCFYIDNGVAGISNFDVRLTPCQGKAAGTMVADADTVEKAAVATAGSPFAASLNFADVNNNGRYDMGDYVYVDSAAAAVGLTASSAVGAWTIRLTPAAGKAAGTLVFAGDADFTSYGATAPILVSGAGAQITFFDADNDGGITAGDNVYLWGAATAPTVGGLFPQYSVRLAGTPVASGPNPGGNPNPSSSQTSTTGNGSSTSATSGTVSTTSHSATGTTTGTNPTGSTGTTSSGGQKTPGFELVALVAALGAALVLVRRKL